MRRRALDPETRVGICCGVECRKSPTWDYVTLYKVAGVYRYRCADCYEKEVGWRHRLAPISKVPS